MEVELPVEERMVEKVPARKSILKQKGKQRLLVSGGVEAMDVD